jgi:hypothetical protein
MARARKVTKAKAYPVAGTVRLPTYYFTDLHLCESTAAYVRRFEENAHHVPGYWDVPAAMNPDAAAAA